jgi:hypothetical protein
MPSCVPVLDFVPDRLRVLGAVSTGSVLGGSGSWLERGDSLDISSELVFSRLGSELDVAACVVRGGVRVFVAMGSLRGDLLAACSRIGDGRGDGKCVVVRVAVPVGTVAAEPLFRASLSCVLSTSVAPSIVSPSLAIRDGAARLDALASAACGSRSIEMPRPSPVPWPLSTSDGSISHYGRTNQRTLPMVPWSGPNMTLGRRLLLRPRRVGEVQRPGR